MYVALGNHIFFEITYFKKIFSEVKVQQTNKCADTEIIKKYKISKEILFKYKVID